MGGGERGKEARARRGEKKRRLPIPEKYQRGVCALGYFFGVKTMALDILHNVIIGQPVRLDACISKGKGCAKRTYNATLCNLASTDLHTGINGMVVVVGVKCLFALFFWIGTALCNRKNEDCNVLLSVGKKQRKKYDSCKRWQCHRRQTKRWACAVGVWLKPSFFLCVREKRWENLFLLNFNKINSNSCRMTESVICYSLSIIVT